MMHAAPYYGRPLFASADEAAARLRQFTGRDFGTDAVAWGDWLRCNRWVYHASVRDPRLEAPVCTRCHGRGKVESRRRAGVSTTHPPATCPECQGRGIIVA